jgi:molybdenum cofactor synthesis domain-containing protein
MDRFRDEMRAVVLTISDRCAAGTQVDLSGPRLVEVLTQAGLKVASTAIYPDEVTEIAHGLRHFAAEADLIVTTGGTGLSPRDVTPEATREVCDRLVPGLAERMRAAGLGETALAPLSRAVCGCVGRTLIVNTPGSPAGAETSLRAILHLLPHALHLLSGQGEHLPPGPAEDREDPS